MIKLLERLDSHFKTRGSQIALSDDPSRHGIDYSHLDKYSGRIYRYLKERGIGREDFVMLCLPRGVRFPIAMVGVWKAGAAFVVCEETYAEERINFIRNDCECKLVISDENWAEIMETEYLPGRETADPHDLAYAVYTSGTTGNPKGVLHEYGNLDESCDFKRWDGERLMTESDILALNAPLNFVAAQDYINNVLYSGAMLFVVSYAYVKNPPALIALYEKIGVTCTFMTPSAFRVLPALNSQMRWIVLGGELCAGLYRDGVTLLNGYNMSEAGCDLCLFRIERPYDVTPIGQNRGNRVIRLLDEDGNDVQDGEPGEICYENPHVRGYNKLPEKTALAWKNGLFHTGDIAVRNAEDDLILQGRNDDMIKINGNRIEPGEIEAVCKKLLNIDWVCAKGFADEKQAFIVLYYLEDIKIDTEYLRTELSKSLPQYMIPSYYVKIDEIPMLPNGKINKKALAAPDKNSYRAAYAAPEDPEQEMICRVFGKILEMDHIGIDDDFYDLGGDSIRSIRAAQELEGLGVNVSLLYKHRTARKLSAVLSETRFDGKTDDERNVKALEHDQPLGYFHLYMFDYQLYAPRSIMWNMPRCWKFNKKDVDPGRLAAAIEKVMDAHPVFRTLLRYDENYELVQHYEGTLPLKVEIERVADVPDTDMMSQYVQPFKLLNEPMYRVKLFETDDSICVFLDMHHIISDGISMQVLMDDLTKAYEGRELDADYYYLSLRDQYKNVVSEDYIRSKEYFEKQYGGKEWVYGLTPEKESRKSAFDRVIMPLGISEDDLEVYLKSAGISRNAFLQTVALLTIARMENADNVMLGWVYSGRDEQKKRSAVGLLIREIPLGLSLNELPDVGSLYESVKQQMSQGLANRGYPYLTANASVAVNDVFCFIDEGDILNLQILGGIPCEEIPLATTNALGWMMALTFFNADGIFMCMNYTPVRYNRETMEKYCGIYQQIAAKLLKSVPDTAVKELL